MAAEAVLDITLYDGPHSLRIFHVVNTDTSTSWGSVLDWILQRDDVSFERVPPSQWVQKLADTKDPVSENPSRKLLGLWEANVSFPFPPGCEVLMGIVRRGSGRQEGLRFRGWKYARAVKGTGVWRWVEGRQGVCAESLE